MTRAEVLANFQVIKDQIEHFGEVFFDESDIPMIDAVIELLKGEMMSRYIDADALIRDLKRQYMFLFGADELPSGIQGVIENFPTADVVPTSFHDKCMRRERGQLPARYFSA